MRVTFITNYLTHHQLPFAQEMYRLLGEDFAFVATDSMEEERIRMGWALDGKKYPFFVEHDEDYGRSERLIMDCDVLICGGAHESYIHKRLEAGRLTFRYFERLYKKGRIRAFTPRGYFRKWREHTKYRSKPVYLLCAGAYVPADFSLFFAYPDKMLQWGYFPEMKTYPTEELLKEKEGIPELLWTGRMLGWKRGMDAVSMASRLKKDGQKFHLTMIGEGECLAGILEKIKQENLEKEVTVLPFQKPETVRAYMERAAIYLLTSDYEEGWGAVVNEAMNSGCAVVAGAAAGCVPYLIKHKKNGLVYRSGDVEELTALVTELLKDNTLRETLGRTAYDTIVKEWNAQHAAKCFVEFCENLEKKNVKFQTSGPMSKAPLISPKNGYVYTRKST